MQFLPLLYISNAILLFYSPSLRFKFSSTGWSGLPGWFGWSTLVALELVLFPLFWLVGIFDLIDMVAFGWSWWPG
jgi:hypothetical protein